MIDPQKNKNTKNVLESYFGNSKDFTSQDLKNRADRIGNGEQKHDWFLIIFILLFACLLAGALSGLIF